VNEHPLSEHPLSEHTVNDTASVSVIPSVNETTSVDATPSVDESTVSARIASMHAASKRSLGSNQEA
jgi:hypothetical protein